MQRCQNLVDDTLKKVQILQARVRFDEASQAMRDSCLEGWSQVISFIRQPSFDDSNVRVFVWHIVWAKVVGGAEIFDRLAEVDLEEHDA